MGRVLYDCFWITTTLDQESYSAAPGDTSSGSAGATIRLPAQNPAAILFPSFFTPAFVFEGFENPSPTIDLIIATPAETAFSVGDNENRIHEVNERLVFRRFEDNPSSWVREARVDGNLFGDPIGKIKVEEITPDATDSFRSVDLFRIPRTEREDGGTGAQAGSFTGALYPGWHVHYDKIADGDPQYSIWQRAKYWHVRVAAECLERTCRDGVGSGRKVVDEGDEAIRRLFKRRGGESFKEPRTFGIAASEKGGFEIFTDLVTPESPLILLHRPIAVYSPESKGMLRGFLHVSDLHINMRQDVLAQSPARVVEYPLNLPDSQDVLACSPAIGTLVHLYHRSIGELLMSSGQPTSSHSSGEPDCIIIGGDLVDHLRSAVLKPSRIPQTAKAVWDDVNLDGAYLGDYSKRYEFSPDMVAAFTLFRKVCTSRQVPMLGITGNHDAYEHGYGIAPRVLNSSESVERANEGIPADHNLTLFEAILAFGKSYHRWNGANLFNFTAECFEWFHTIFTPFTDVVYGLNEKQRLAALGWGMSEDLLSLARPSGRHFPDKMGYLPRANSALRRHQLALLNECAATSEKDTTFLATHFTFASFHEAIPEQPQPKGVMPFKGQLWNKYNFGTFELKREEAYQILAGTPQANLRKKAFTAVVTGHSHRRAVYSLQVDPNGATAIMNVVDQVPLSLTSQGRGTNTVIAPNSLAVILSDSAGPLPRRNKLGEFGEWGSDAPGASFISLDEQGKCQQVQRIQSTRVSTSKPRAVVSLDYVHHLLGSVWKDGAVLTFRLTPSWWACGEADDHRVGAATIELEDRWAKYGIHVEAVRFLGRIPTDVRLFRKQQATWISVKALANRGLDQSTAEPRGETSGSLILTINTEEERETVDRWLKEPATASDRFIAVKFGVDCNSRRGDSGVLSEGERKELAARYNWESWWTFEVLVQNVSLTPGVDIWTVRARENKPGAGKELDGASVAEQPSFTHREKVIGGTYEKARYADRRGSPLQPTDPSR